MRQERALPKKNRTVDGGEGPGVLEITADSRSAAPAADAEPSTQRVLDNFPTKSLRSSKQGTGSGGSTWCPQAKEMSTFGLCWLRYEAV